MVFGANTAFATSLIALAAGTALLLWASQSEACCKGFGKVVGYFVVVASILSLLCVSYNSLKRWDDGDLDNRRHQRIRKKFPNKNFNQRPNHMNNMMNQNPGPEN